MMEVAEEPMMEVTDEPMMEVTEELNTLALDNTYMGRIRPSRELKQDLMKLAFCEFQVFGILKLNLLLAGIWYLLVSSQILYLYRALQMLYL